MIVTKIASDTLSNFQINARSLIGWNGKKSKGLLDHSNVGGDSLNIFITEALCWRLSIESVKNRSPTSKTCHQHKLSPTCCKTRHQDRCYIDDVAYLLSLPWSSNWKAVVGRLTFFAVDHSKFKLVSNTSII